MSSEPRLFSFQQLHVDVARNATDDFNPFHDSHRWRRVSNNPYGAPIAMGFQLEFLVDCLLDQYRDEVGEGGLADENDLHFSNYEFKFADAIRPGEDFQVEIRRTIRRVSDGGGLFNRFMVRKSEGSLVLIGNRSDTREPRFPAANLVPHIPPLDLVADRTQIAGTPFFLKRKFMIASNAKNFALGSLVDPRYYFDELEDRIYFPPIFVVSLVSCALLEKKWKEGYDFERNPVVYISHQISVDRRLQRGVRSNNRLDILVDGPSPVVERKGLGGSSVQQNLYRCFGVLGGDRLLFRALVHTADLSLLVNATAGGDP